MKDIIWIQIVVLLVPQIAEYVIRLNVSCVKAPINYLIWVVPNFQEEGD